ncbi:MAG TPA: ABC transporter permease, partial [Solirubrobacteraceae bacterium]|nr:ABC transporter permease [Solirubrobacteraceae bacterium]
MFGIVLGTCGVLVISCLGQAQNAALAQQLAQLGSNVVSITPGIAALGGRSAGAGSKPTLMNRDVQLIQQQVPYLRALTPLVSETQTLVVGAHTVGATVVGAYTADEAVQSNGVRLGAFFTDSDEANHAPVAVLGQTVVDELFPGTSSLGATVRIGGADFRVAGVLWAKGHSGQTDLDDVVIVPFSTAQQRLFGPKLDSILLQAERTDDIPAIMAAVTVTLGQSHHIPAGGRADFAIQNYQRVVDTA